MAEFDKGVSSAISVISMSSSTAAERRSKAILVQSSRFNVQSLFRKDLSSSSIVQTLNFEL